MATVNEWSPSDENEESLMKKTLELLKNGEEKITLQDQFKKIVLVVGDTGNGKTTFTKWIAGDDTKLTAIETTANTGEYTIEDIDGTPSSITISDTVYPLLVVDKETNVPYYDCPGFNDTRNTKYDIATTHFIKKIVDFADSVKIIFIINYPWVRIGVDRRSFMQLLKQATEFIKNIEKLKNSFALVVTKVDNSYINRGTCLVEDNAIIAGIADFLKKVRLELEAQVQGSQERQFYEAAIKFISYFLKKDGEQYANIGIFRRPDKSGPLSKIPLLLKCKENIKRIIYQNLTFSEKVDDDFSYTISLKSKNIIARIVEEINKNVWQSLGYITEELGKYYSTLTYEVRKQILLIGYVDSLLEADDLRIEKLSCCLRRGIKNLSYVIKDVESVQSRYDLAQRIKSFIVDSEIGDFKTEISNIENQGKYFDFLQVVSEEKLNTRSWDELFRKVLDSIFDVQKKLQEDIDDLGPKIRKHVLSCFDMIAKDLQNQLDGKIKILDLQDIHDKLNDFRDSILWLVEKGKNVTNAKEFLKLIRDVTCRIMINVPNEAAMHIIKLENCLNSLQIFCKTNCIFVSSAWFQPFENLIDQLNEHKVWYNFLTSLYHTFSEYEIQKEKEKYTVDDNENWENAEAASEISITETNFQQFLQNISQNNVSELEIIKNIELTEDRIEELNRMLNLALNEKVIMDSTNSSIFITGDYIRISNFIKITNFINDILTFSSLTKLGQFKSVYIFALNTVYIDEDLKLPSLNVIIIAPKWEIIGKRKICLDGTGRARELGLTEKSGRIFFGIGETFINGAQLTITVEGGNMSSGQNGDGRKSGESGNQVIVQGQKHRSTTFFTISGAKSNKTWNLEECILNYDRVDSERDDTDGANIKGLRFSQLANNISEPFKIINKYTKYLAEQLKHSFKRFSLLSFYKRLNDNNGIISIYNTVGLIEEFQEIEQENDSSSLKQSYLIPIYQSMLSKISIHAKLTENPDDDHMKVLKYLCTAILSKISILRDESQANLIVDIGRHLDMIKTDIEMLKDLYMQSKSLISKCKEYYNYDVNKRVEEVKNFILKHILPELNAIQRQVDKDIKCLIIETIKLQKDAKKEKDKLILMKQKLEDSLAQKQVLYCFDIIAKVITFLCAVGAAIGLAIEKVASKVDLLALNETEISSKKVPNITSILQLFESEIIRVKNGALNHLNTLLRAISYQVKRYPESLKDLLKVIEEIQIRKNNVNEKNLRLAEIKMIEDDIKQEIIKKEQKLRSQLEISS
ncbi:hypothetical protein HNY73_009522 [Argiope bruennichi]|uniref:G domain-containing protein n=1 Tax=Argiope bruennichi TaxID=94029 RepID=A0A8T0FEY8_ARGBR|nr:hypothetical protein HNY73_009522 [Argiope bruennichi]